MKSLTFTQRIGLVVAVALGAGMSLTGVSLYRQKQITDGYSQLIRREVLARRLTLSAQVAFKTQVQEWKNVLLRGYQPENLKKYSASFHTEEAAVHAKMDSLATVVALDTMGTRLASEFSTAHAQMGAKYSTAMEHFSAGKGLDPISADAEVKGQDRPPTELLTQLGEHFTKQADLVVAATSEQASRDRRNMAIVALVVLAVAVWFTTYMVSRLRRSVHAIGERVEQVREEAIAAMGRACDELARGSLDGTIDFDVPLLAIETDDEIGALARSVNGIVEQTRASALAFDTARRNLQDLLAETSRLVSDAKQGQLRTRGDATRFEGGYRELLEGFNSTLDAVIAPITEASAVLERVAKRDLTARVQGNYAGDHETVKRALNTAVSQLETALVDINASTDQVASAGEQIATGSASLARVTGEQASSIEEVSSSLQELTSMSRKSSESAKAASELVGEARVSATAGVTSTRELSDAMVELKASADSTAKIVKTIDEIAFQTNLLALNAAVEAARAGDAGRGFAVVAEEVRNLAIRSAEAAKNTAVLIADSVSRAHRGGEMSHNVLAKFSEIEDRVGKVSAMMVEIGQSSQQQVSGVSQIASAVEQLSRSTQEVAATSEESAAAAHELAAQASSTRESVSEFALSSSSRTSVGASTGKSPASVSAKPRGKSPRTSAKVPAMAGATANAGDASDEDWANWNF